MKALLVYLKDYKKETVLAPFFKMLEAVFELIIPLVIKSMIDHGIQSKDKDYIIKMCFIMILLGLTGMTCSVTAQYFSAKAAAGLAAGIRYHLFEHIESLGFSEIDRLGTSALITRMTSDINQIQSGVNLVLRLFMRSPFIVFGSVFMAFTIDIKAAFIFVVVIPILSVIIFGIMILSVPLYKKVQTGLEKLLGVTRDNLTGVRVLRAYNLEESEANRFHEGSLRLTALQLFVGKILAVMNPVTYIILNAAIICLLWIGADKVFMGVLTTGAVIALVNYMSQILIELVKLANLIITVTKAAACGNRVQSIFEQKAGIDKSSSGKFSDTTSEDMQEAFIVFKNVSFCYHKDSKEALSDINLTVKKGETIGIIGGTGSGKSTLVYLIPRFYDVTTGEILLNGKNVKDYRVKELRSKIGIVMQKAVLFKGTILDNLQWGKKVITDIELNEALEVSQAKEFIGQKEKRLDSVIEEGGKNLSGGQRQRLTIARALVKNPEILILDDSASALDYATDARLRRAIDAMKNKPTVFIVSQRTSAIMNANQIVVLDNGKITGIGTHGELLKSCSVYREIYASQFRGSELKETEVNSVESENSFERA